MNSSKEAQKAREKVVSEEIDNIDFIAAMIALKHGGVPKDYLQMATQIALKISIDGITING